MLLHQPELPFFAISGDYYPLSSTPSTLTQTALPGALFALPLPAAVIPNNQAALRSLIHPDRFCQTSRNQSFQPTVHHSSNPYQNPVNPNPSTMPKQTIPKGTEDNERSAFQAPPLPMIAGGKRGASAVSGHDALPHLTASSGQPESEDMPLRLPPKLKEAERMMHVQRWVNHLPGPGTDNGSSDGLPVYWGFSNSPGFRNIDEDRELTPPPSRTYLSRLPFTPEEEQTMMRFFSHNSEHRHQHPSGAVHNSYAVNNQSNYPPYHNQRATVAHQAPTTNHHFALPVQQTAQGPTGELDTAPQCVPKSGPHRRPEQEASGGNRFFAEWEIRLISHLFHEYFPGRPEPMGNNGVLPSVGEVRSRIASSRLKETRSAIAIRAKIKRMQSSGTWVEYQ